MAIDLDRGVDWKKVKWWMKFSLTMPLPRKIERVKCGYCEGKGFIAVDVDKLVIRTFES
jgi:hypothetical protein